MTKVILASLLALAQATSSPSFEVVSVKRSDPNAGASSPIGAIPMILPAGPRLTATNVTLRLLVRSAYELPDFKIVGGPSWQTTDRFDITAKAEDGFTGSFREMMPMLRTVLADRFKLKTHMETRELPIYSLVVAREDRRLGDKLKPSASNCGDIYAEAQKRIEAALKGGAAGLASLLPKPGEKVRCSLAPVLNAAPAFGLTADGLPISFLARLLTELTGRDVRDKTGLEGLYDWELRFDPQVLLQLAANSGINIPAGALAGLPSSGAPSLMTALQEQLGLELESDRGPVEVLVIDSAEPPTAD